MTATACVLGSWAMLPHSGYGLWTLTKATMQSVFVRVESSLLLQWTADLGDSPRGRPALAWEHHEVKMAGFLPKLERSSDV